MKILLVPGNPGWAFDYRAKDLLSLKFDGIEVELKYVKKVMADDKNRYDLIYPMSINIAKKLHKRTAIPYNKMATGITSIRIIDNHTNNHSDETNFVRFLKGFRGINTSSEEIKDRLTPYIPIAKTRVGIDETLFKPLQKRNENERFKVGWVGRIDQEDYRQLKGYDLVLAALKDIDVELDIRTYKDRVPREEMAAFYQQLDCFICSSTSEHIPLPLLEAAACGVPLISTRVGIAPELITHNKNGFIVPRTPDAFQSAVKALMDSPEKRKKFSKRIRGEVVKHWTLKACKAEWETFFLSLQKCSK
ncbi:glycosyltransferase family 4 protein [Shouchella clausii]|uniref:Glycosyl transferase family 1 domain-containing protein n=1 Tax=Shouchella clausii (strain KSM-K16) TaxID=66692 RepID=Q5WKQ3_SHOC1|nr:MULTISPECIES: glycosyltransferase family 4 protein [Shouchella]ALA52357.1 hypothetical protein DB29_01529 [Shouchella clausii]MBU3230213.1 glycosyltransferase family 4 protein [Shouchella clausii]MBU3262588.1 glycosyltransferase family 4 protein [Shouchella clausii]MBU3507097.1 glycosyltransferase family 4 protein [Shouchella clausii]MBU3534621.1 glycosyltransferase family 4 protein [Shouchella clausii]